MIVEEKYLDIIKEFINIGMGESAELLNQMINSHVTLSAPQLKIMEFQHLAKELGDLNDEVLASVNMPFSDGIEGVARLVFPSTSASKLVDLFVGNQVEDSNSDDLDAIRVSAMIEVGNIIINTVMGSISNQLDVQLNYVIPDFFEGNFNSVFKVPNTSEEHMILFCMANFKAKEVNISGNFVLFFKIGQFNKFIQKLEKYYKSISN